MTNHRIGSQLEELIICVTNHQIGSQLEDLITCTHPEELSRPDHLPLIVSQVLRVYLDEGLELCTKCMRPAPSIYRCCAST